MNIVDVGLIYRIAVEGQDGGFVDLTMTSPACPMGDMIFEDVEAELRKCPAAQLCELADAAGLGAALVACTCMSEKARQHFRLGNMSRAACNEQGLCACVLFVAALCAMGAGLLAGLARLGFAIVPAATLAGQHGPLMICGAVRHPDQP